MSEKPQKNLIYVTRDIERALGIEPLGSYFIISNDSPYGRDMHARYPNNIFLITDTRGMLDTYDLLLLPKVKEIISTYNADILVFQNTPRIERLVTENGWKLLNPSAVVSQKIEEKISQIDFLGSDASLLPRHQVMETKDVVFEDKKYVLQFNHSHTGQGTYIIESEEALKTLKEKFPHRHCRVVDFIDGPVFTVNSVVPSQIHEPLVVGNPSYQITGLKPFTDLPFSTIGNDWALPHFDRYAKVIQDIQYIAQCVGKHMRNAGWRGLFGIDVVYDETAQKTYLLEINARQPASAVFESILQKECGDEKGLTIIEAHHNALTGVQNASPLIRLTSGSQIVKRITHTKTDVNVEALCSKKLTVITYENSLHNKELFRIQSREGIMKNHNVLNEQGIFITSCMH